MRQIVSNAGGGSVVVDKVKNGEGSGFNAVPAVRRHARDGYPGSQSHSFCTAGGGFAGMMITTVHGHGIA